MRRIVIASEWETRGVVVLWDIWASHPPLWSRVFRMTIRLVYVFEWETRRMVMLRDIWASHPPLRSGVFRANMRLMFAINRKTGAGEEIRTLDPNLGKVVLYP